ncbi:MAG: hypothetical protein ACN6OP_25855, partial [Pseudomonadales bacterium]
AGTDTPAGGGTEATSFKTLDYAVQQSMASLAYEGTQLQILLKVGETFAMTDRYSINTNVNIDIGFYGDPRGDVNTMIGNTPLWMLSDVVKPVIVASAFLSDGLWTSSGFGSPAGTGRVRLLGVQLNAAVLLNPAVPPALDTYGQAAFLQTARAGLYGAVVNKPDNSPFGFWGISPRVAGCALDQFGSQFRVRGNLINTPPSSSITPADLACRQYFVQFYPDLAGNDFVSNHLRLSPSALTGSNSSGVMTLMWSDVGQQTSGSTTTQATFPVLSDVNYGFANYVFGLRRDQQARPLNVISGRLF